MKKCDNPEGPCACGSWHSSKDYKLLSSPTNNLYNIDKVYNLTSEYLRNIKDPTAILHVERAIYHLSLAFKALEEAEEE